MKTSTVTRLSVEIISKYYQNDLQPFFSYLDEDALWYGPAKGQFLSGRKTILAAWKVEANPLHFTLGDIRVDYTTTNPCYCEVMVSFPVTTHFPDGENIPVDEIIHISWCERKIEATGEKCPRMRVIHISNLYQQHISDHIYPIHFNQIYKGYVPIVGFGKRLFFRGADHADYYLLSASIQWIESSQNSRHGLLHMDGKVIEVTTSLPSIEKAYPDLFLRCHLCYLVNPQHVTQVRRFVVTLADGTELPIPEKKYTTFKKEVKEYWDNSAPPQG